MSRLGSETPEQATIFRLQSELADSQLEVEKLQAALAELERKMEVLEMQQTMDTECIERIRMAGERDAARAEEVWERAVEVCDSIAGNDKDHGRGVRRGAGTCALALRAEAKKGE